MEGGRTGCRGRVVDVGGWGGLLGICGGPVHNEVPLLHELSIHNDSLGWHSDERPLVSSPRRLRSSWR